jgi:hypothetical protein
MYLQDTANSLTYMTAFEANNASIRVSRMRNAAGSVVSPTQAAVQAAMTAFRTQIDEGQYAARALSSQSL